MKQKICALALTVALSTTLFTTPALAAEVSFSDTSAHWAREAISAVVEKGLFQGTSADTFSPNMSMNRGMFVTVLGRFAEGIGCTISGTAAFDDVSSSAYYAPYVAWASSNGIVQGVGGGLFAPGSDVTREQMCALFVRFLTFMGYPLPAGGSLDFADAADISSYAVDAVKISVELGLIQGSQSPEGMVFRPADSATRAEVATVFLRLDGLPGIHDLTQPEIPASSAFDKLTPEERAMEEQVAGYLTTMVENYNGMVADKSSYYSRTGPEAKACVAQLMDCINQALNDRANDKPLTKEHIRSDYKGQIKQVKDSYSAMTDQQATEFENIVIRLETLTHLKVVMDYFGVKL